MSTVQSLLSRADKAGTFRTILLIRNGISAALVCLIFVFWMHETVIYSWDLDHHRAQQSHCGSSSHCPGSQAAILIPESFSLRISQQLLTGKWKGMKIQNLLRVRRKEHKGHKGREQMPSTCIYWLLLDVL